MKLPFKVEIRHNVHGGNRDQVPLPRRYVSDLARESGNRITYYPTPVAGNPVSAARGSEVQLLERDASCDIGIERDCRRFSRGHGYFCGAQMLFVLCIDEMGRLYKCWEDVDKPERSFGTASRWKPGNPIGTADHPDALTVYLNTALPLADPECMECVWLPACVGGCPNKRLFAQRDCLPYRDAPEVFVLALAEHLENAHSAKP